MLMAAATPFSPDAASLIDYDYHLFDHYSPLLTL